LSHILNTLNQNMDAPPVALALLMEHP